MAMMRFFNEMRGKKFSEVPEHVKPMLSFNYIKRSIQKALDNYHAKYIETDSPEPLFHVCYGGMIFSYLVALPNERRHLKHQREHAAAHH